MDKLELITIRTTKKPEDTACIANHWINSLRYNNPFFKIIPEDIYYSNYRKVIDLIMNRPDTLYKIACLKDDEDVILGFSVYDARALHWMYVKRSWRKIGLGRDLLPSPMPKYATHITETMLFDPITSKSKKSLPHGLIFNPFNL